MEQKKINNQYILLSEIDQSKINLQDQKGNAGNILKEINRQEVISKTDNAQLHKFIEKYCFQFIFILILLISAAITIQNFTLQEKDRIIRQLSQNAFQIECLEKKGTADFQKCDDFLKKKIKNPVEFKPKMMKEPPLAKLQFKSQKQVASLNSEFTTKIQFGAKLFLNWRENNQDMFQLEYYRLNSEFDLDEPVPEKRICVMAPFRNLLKHSSANSSVHMLLHSVNAQNYSKYHVYMIDDASTDNSTEFILKELSKYPRLNNRITLLRNNQSYGALANRDSATRRYCRSGDIILDIDGDDALIGKQVFNLFNRIYQNNPNSWFVYMNFIQIEGSEEGDGRTISLDMNKSKKGPSDHIKEQLFKYNRYRTNLHVWVTSQLRSYLYDLYVKIPLNYLINQETKQYQIKASDRFVMYALVQLAGPQHTYYFEYYPYFYYQPNFAALQKYNCALPIIMFNQAKSRLLAPLKHLNSLDDKVQAIQNYFAPLEIEKYYAERKQKLIQCQYNQKEKQLQSII